jgi:hypothetical protein
MKKNIREYFILLPAICLLQVLSVENVHGQAEVQAWGNITGVRVEGQLMEFESSLRIVGSDGLEIGSTGKEKQSPKYVRDGATQVVTTSVANFGFIEKVKNAGSGKINVDVQATAKTDSVTGSPFFCLEIPYGHFSNGTLSLSDGKARAIGELTADSRGECLKASARAIRFVSGPREIRISWKDSMMIVLKSGQKNGERFLQLYLPVQTADQAFTISASGEIDRHPANLVLDPSREGRVFEGLGGNFRIQNIKADPGVIDYCLKNLRVAWGRVEMPWRFWQPQKNLDPTSEAKAGRLHPIVQRAMEMAQKLSAGGIPIILTAWFPPNWAVTGKISFRHLPGGEWGNPLNKDSVGDIYRSIADYIVYLKESYGVDIRMFSFNESDLGINIRQTGQEHADLIKGLGAYFVSRGLKTKMLLGDNSDATTYEFIYPAMKDPDTRAYMGAISFHSWRGWEKETLEKWASAAKELNLPLIVGEGSIDAAAWAYPDIFQESTYALEEINLYIRLLAICQPLSILQWQLTSDYSPLTGGGVYGKEGPLQPTRRFWNLRQLSSTPANLAYIAVACDRPNITCAALGSHSAKSYALHIVNNGATRKISLSGIPPAVKSFRVFVTDQDRSMKEEPAVKVTGGRSGFTLDAGAYMTLISN